MFLAKHFMKKSYPLVIVLFFSWTTISAQNKLEKSKSELNSSSRSNTNSGNSSSRSSSSSDDDNGFGFFGDLFFYITFGVFKYGFIGDYKNEDHLYSNLTPYPFYNGKSGNYESIITETISKNVGRIDVENKFIYNSSSLLGNHLELKARPFQYFYIQADYRELFEFNKVQNTTNNLSLLHLNLAYDRVRLERFNLGWNIGTSYVGNEVGKFGFSFGLSADYFMTNQISFSGSQQWSSINGFPVNALDLQSKYHKKHYFFTIGYERLKIATPVYNFISIGGGIYF